MKKVIAVYVLLFVLSLVPSLLVKAQSTGTTYTQTTHGCVMTHCADAQFTPTATLGYSAEFQYCGDKNVDMFVAWNGTDYTDGKASMNFLGYSYKGVNYYPWGVYEMVGTFNNGTATITEHTRNYRGCSGGTNIDGFVTTTP